MVGITCRRLIAMLMIITISREVVIATNGALVAVHETEKRHLTTVIVEELVHGRLEHTQRDDDVGQAC